MEDFYQIFEDIILPGKKVLATIINVKGSAYKREGSLMVFSEDGKQAGMLSAGCLETDLALRAEEVMETEKPMMVQYDLFAEDDLGWGQGAGCNGAIDILLEPVSNKLQADLIHLKELLDRESPVLCLKSLEHLGEYIFLSKVEKPFGIWSGSIPASHLNVKSGISSDLQIFLHTYLPKPRFFVFGAGPDVQPLVNLAADTGFFVYVCDWRESFCTKDNFPKAERLILGDPKEIMKQITFTPNDFAAIMTHHFQKDREILLVLLSENIKYLGILGPKERTKRLLYGENIPDWISAPIGVPIGAKGSAEIAVSIVAEMIEVWRKSIRASTELVWTPQN